MLAIMLLATYLVGAFALVALALQSKNRALSARHRSLEDDEQMRAIAGRAVRGSGSDRDPVATAH